MTREMFEAIVPWLEMTYPPISDSFESKDQGSGGADEPKAEALEQQVVGWRSWS